LRLSYIGISDVGLLRTAIQIYSLQFRYKQANMPPSPEAIRRIAMGRPISCPSPYSFWESPRRQSLAHTCYSSYVCYGKLAEQTCSVLRIVQAVSKTNERQPHLTLYRVRQKLHSQRQTVNYQQK